MISLNLVGFELAKVDKGKKIKKLQASSVRDLKKVVGKSRLYVVPRAEVSQPINLPLNQPSTGSNSETTEPIDLPLSQPSTGPNSETTEPINLPLSQPSTGPNSETTETSDLPLSQPITGPEPETTNELEEWRAIRRQQDQEYEQSLRADQEKMIEERLMRTNEEPADGIPLKFTFPDGTMKIRRFQVFDQIQALFDFVGTHSSATEYFYIREATSAVSISSTVPGTLLDHYLTAPMNIHVRWMDMEDVQAIFHQQNSVLLPSPDEFETSEVQDDLEIMESMNPDEIHSDVDLVIMDSASQEEMYSNHSETVSEIMDPGPEIYTNYINIMPDNDLPEPDDQGHPDDSEVMYVEDIVCSTEDILLELGKEINYNLSCRFNINRKNILDGAFRAFGRKSYDPFRRISVRFSDECGNFEEAVDLGGPRREFLSLLMEEIEKSAVLAGPDGCKNLALDSVAVREDRYYLVGKAIAVSMVHGGPSPGFFSSTLFECISNGQVSPTIEDVNDLDLQAKIKKISDASTMEELCEATECMSEYLANAGCLRAVKCLKDKDLLLQDILLFQVVNRLHGPLERLKEGLRTLGLLEAVVKHKDAFRPLFCSPPQPLTADALDHLFDIRYSTAGSNKRAEENTIVAFWRDYLLDAEEGTSSCTLQKILTFATGCSALPAVGLKPKPSIEFLHPVDTSPWDTSQREKFPTANTCINCLRLPLHKNYDLFKSNMDFAICNTQGFGQE
ncbi:uncharacterized protein [Garra rufa]|uniref:uncharacterized protein n=1 Tax=Garra rufa TaxID=137080 RepID=UPI003CCE7430